MSDAPTFEKFQSMPPVWQLSVIRTLPDDDARALIDQLSDDDLASLIAENEKNCEHLERRIDSVKRRLRPYLLAGARLLLDPPKED